MELPRSLSLGFHPVEQLEGPLHTRHLSDQSHGDSGAFHTSVNSRCLSPITPLNYHLWIPPKPKPAPTSPEATTPYMGGGFVPPCLNYKLRGAGTQALWPLSSGSSCRKGAFPPATPGQVPIAALSWTSLAQAF